MSEPKETRLDSTLSKGLRVLETIAGSRGGIGVSELSRRLDLTKSNTFRLLQTLVALGFVRQESDKTYSATLKTWQVGREVVENLNLRAAAAEMMRYLSDETSETIYLAVRDGLNVVYIDKIDSLKPIQSWNPIGGTAPITNVGTGKALLCAEYPALRNSAAANLKAYTTKSILDLETLDKDMGETRLRGYAVDHGEYRPNIVSIGSAISLPDGVPAGALGVSVPNVHLQDGDIERIGALVQQASVRVSKVLARL